MASVDETQNSAEIKSATKIDEDDQQLVAGRKPAVKVGGMRVVQHKNTSSSSSTEESNLEDVTGLTTEPNITPNPKSISGAPDIGNAAFSTNAARVSQHIDRPAKHVRPHVTHHINQPSKQ